MPNKPLPTRLRKEPLIDAVFEVRFDASVSSAEIMPGFLHSNLDGGVKIERLPIASLPTELRQRDPNLVNQPLVRIFWQNYIIHLGDKSFGVACVLPYPGWKSFREVILKMMDFLAKAKIVNVVQRYSLKYVDILESKADEGIVDLINLAIVVGGAKLKNQALQLHMEVSRTPFLHSLQIASPAKVQLLNGSVRQGLVVSIDTFSVGTLPGIEEIVKELPSRLDAIHMQNKQMFFDCLTEHAVTSLEPSYE